MKRVVLAIVGIVGAVMAFVVLVPDFWASTSNSQSWRSENPDLAAYGDLMGARRDSILLFQSVRERLVALETVRQGSMTRRTTRATLATRATRATLTVIADPSLSVTTRTAFEQRVRKELAPLGDSLRYAIRVHVVHDSALGGEYRRIAVLPRDDTEPCAIVFLVPRPPGIDVVPSARDRLIGTCGLYATFGAPGPGMHQWLLATRGTRAVSDIAMRTTGRGERYRLTGPDIIMDPEVAACIAGSDSACVATWRRTAWVRNALDHDSSFDSLTRGTVRAYPSSAMSWPGRNLGELRGAMTDAQFAELWRSTKAPEEAYEEIEGQSIAHVVRDRFLFNLQPHRPGPLHADLPILVGIAFGAAAALLAIQLTKRARS